MAPTEDSQGFWDDGSGNMIVNTPGAENEQDVVTNILMNRMGRSGQQPTKGDAPAMADEAGWNRYGKDAEPYRRLGIRR
jgi:hypothetical protein